MSKYRYFFIPDGKKVSFSGVVSSPNFKTALTMINASLRVSYKSYELKAVIESDFDSSLFNI